MSKINGHKPGYKHTPLGWIPENWEIKELGEVLTLKRGYDLTHSQRKDGIVPVITSGGVNGFHDTSMAKGPGVITGRYGTVGEVFYCKSDYWPHNTTLYVKEFKLVTPIYAYHLLRSINFRSYSDKSAVPGINRNHIHAEVIAVPPEYEQQKIATILNFWDETIAKIQQLISQLQQRNKGLMQQLLKPKSGWKEYRIGELLKEVKRPVKWDDEEVYHLISVRRRSGGAFFRESLFGKQILTKQLFTAEEGDFLISKMQIVHGASAIVTPALAGMKISGSYIAVHAKDERMLDMQFFNWVSKTPWFYKLTYISSYGVHIEKMTFDYDDFKRHKILLPPTIQEQFEIVVVLQTAVEEVKLYEQRLAALQQQKKGLMQKLLTGEIRVKIVNNQN